MNKFLFLILFAGSFYTMLRHGPGRAFAYWLLPAVLLVNFAKSVSMPALPNLTSLNMVLYGVVCGLPFRWHELKKVRWNTIDSVLTLLLVPTFITVIATTGDIKLAQRQAMETVLCQMLFPYFMARLALQDADGRRAALNALCVCTVVIGLLTAIEASGLKPNFAARGLSQYSLDTIANRQVMYRFGMARAIATAGQPIDLGNVGVLCGTMILVLIPATGTKWSRPLPLCGILGAGAMVFGSVSITPWLGLVSAFAFYFLLARPLAGKYLVVPILLGQIALMVGMSYTMLHEPISPDRPADAIEASRWIRVRIIQDAWEQASTAGWFGYGKTLDFESIGVGSVDNAYLLFLMQTGWVSLVLWLVLLLVIASKGTAALARATTPSERLPVAAAMAGILAIVFAMYTVYFGFAYAILFMAVVGMLSTMHQMLARRPAAAYSPYGTAMPRGFEVMAGGAR